MSFWVNLSEYRKARGTVKESRSEMLLYRVSAIAADDQRMIIRAGQSRIAEETGFSMWSLPFGPLGWGIPGGLLRASLSAHEPGVLSEEGIVWFSDSEDRIVRQGFLNAVAVLGQDEEPGADDAKRNIQALVDTASRQDLKALAEDLLLSALGSAWHGNLMEVIYTAHEWIATLQEVKVSGRRIKRILAAREELRK